MLEASRSRRPLVTALVLVALLVVLAAAPATAITNGRLDGNGHPHVGLMIAKSANGNVLWRCSGTLMSPTVFMTAGHCTEAPAARAEVWFAAGPIPLGTGFNPQTRACAANATGYPCVGEVSGVAHVHPAYNPNLFFYRDLGVVVLNTPVERSTYGRLPALNSLDRLKPGKRSSFTAVGYGLQRSSPSPLAFLTKAERTRMVSNPHLLQINTPGFTGDFSLLLSNNAKTGGTCFGDSGGPNFLGSSNVVAGVTSFGLNPTCAGTGGVFRVDRSWSLNWLATFGITP
ncbi:MAG TPA: trypsin-like serine protease [Candidatus Limnocylindrales bacterium]|nr:trypsin-like serine protease [Candidatus Limnocylindrales bacterium]